MTTSQTSVPPGAPVPPITPEPPITQRYREALQTLQQAHADLVAYHGGQGRCVDVDQTVAACRDLIAEAPESTALAPRFDAVVSVFGQCLFAAEKRARYAADRCDDLTNRLEAERVQVRKAHDHIVNLEADAAKRAAVFEQCNAERSSAAAQVVTLTNRLEAERSAWKSQEAGYLRSRDAMTGRLSERAAELDAANARVEACMTLMAKGPLDRGEFHRILSVVVQRAETAGLDVRVDRDGVSIVQVPR